MPIVLGQRVLRQGLRGGPFGGFISAQLNEIWAAWREQMVFETESPDGVTTEINCVLLEHPKGYMEHDKPGDGPHIVFSLSQHFFFVDFTLSPPEAASKGQNSHIMSSPNCPLLLDGQLEISEHAPWWARVERLLGRLQMGRQEMFLVTSSPWDTGPCQPGSVADYLKGSRPVMSAAAEALNPMVWNAHTNFDGSPLVVHLSR